MECENILVDLLLRIVLDKCYGKDGLVWTEHDVCNVVDVSEDPFLNELLLHFVPIGQIGATMIVFRTV